ncbi:hypothetical protein WME75_45040 [Sorangium sp. So ce1014]|uniref:hypothetical protein n=1 Tax=Sorangium sp. So ce1014 TaxID=3133326 RepID=UPI003F5E43BD
MSDEDAGDHGDHPRGIAGGARPEAVPRSLRLGGASDRLERPPGLRGADPRREEHGQGLRAMLLPRRQHESS